VTAFSDYKGSALFMLLIVIKWEG